MIPPDLFTRLRAEQLRAVREQELLSGRNWILICALAHVLALVYPIFMWVHVSLLDNGPVHGRFHPFVSAGVAVLSGSALVACWWWARYAPFRAARLALILFVGIQAAHALFDPRQLAFGSIGKALVVLGLVQAVVVAYRRRRPQ